MDLTTKNTSNNNNNNSCNSISKSSLDLGPASSIPSRSAKIHEEKRKNEQIASVKEEKRRKTRRQENQQENSSQKDAILSHPILLASNSNAETTTSGGGGGASQDSTSGWWMEETSDSYFRVRAEEEQIAREHNKKHLLKSTSAAPELDNKIDSDVVERKGGFGGNKQDSSSRTKTVASRSSSSLYHRLARVDPIVDFFAVDEELLGRFRICSSLTSQLGSSYLPIYSGKGGIQQQQAIIFKIKTTSPHFFWVRPIYGLMRPNVMAWVEVKCEMKATSVAKLGQNMDEFMIEICPVPGAIHTMTNDLYTSCVHSNLPELLSIWERVDVQLKDNQKKLQGFCKEFHRVSCRFQRPSLSFLSSVQSLNKCATPPVQLIFQEQSKSSISGSTRDDEKTKATMREEMQNNNVKIVQIDPFDPTQQTKSVECFHLAREFPRTRHHPDEGKSPKEEQSHADRDHHDSTEETTSCCCNACFRAIRKLSCFSFILALLLFTALGFIFYSQYTHYYIFDMNYESNNNHVENRLQETSNNDNKNDSTGTNKSYSSR